MPFDQIGIAERRKGRILLTLRAEAPDGTALGDAFFDYPSIEAARGAGWNIPEAPRGRSSVPVLAVEEDAT